MKEGTHPTVQIMHNEDCPCLHRRHLRGGKFRLRMHSVVCAKIRYRFNKASIAILVNAT